eukprot:TRINITY_DN135_c0_g2_i1.p1 TRINITY_DN135_c0_g2~~TRINITY_DN135_c0_g2_i1.p1  ORF type:complete len:304 (-),score=37.58 TRINITY_DN135_c0_g2_i1:903-1814(-)
MGDMRHDSDPVIPEWAPTSSSRPSNQSLNYDWSNLLAASQPPETVGLPDFKGVGQNGAAAALSRQYLGLSLDNIQTPEQPHVLTPPPNARSVQSARQLLRSGSDMTASRRDRNRDMVPSVPYSFDPPMQFNQGDERIDLTRSQYEKLKTTIKLLSDQIKDIHEVLQKLMPVLKKILTGPKEEVSQETVQGMLDQLLPRIEENLSQHLHNVQNKVLMNIQSSMESQEAKYQQLVQQVNFLNGGLARRDQEVLETLGQLSEVISAKENYFDLKMEEMKKEMNKRMAEMEAKMVGLASGEASDSEK